MKPGTFVTDFRDDKWRLVQATRANWEGGDGKVLVKQGDWKQEFYARVFDLEVR